MNGIIKRGIALLSALMLIMAVLTLCGCRLSHYDRDEVLSWAKENISPDIVLSSDHVEIGNEDGYTDRVWTACLRSDPDLVFHVFSHEYWGSESITHSIESTYRTTLGEHYFRQYSRLEDTELCADSIQYPFSRYAVSITFRDRADLERVAAHVQAVEEYMKAAGAGDCLSYRISYDDPIATVRETDVFDMFNGDEVDGIAEAMTRAFALYAADYRMATEQFTPEELEQAVSDAGRGFIVTRPDGSTVSYPDLSLSRFGYGMSFGALFEVLNRDGCEVYGSPAKFEFIGVDGCKYEFSYFFNDCPYDSDEPHTGIDYGYYYLRDGEQMHMDYYFYNHLRSDLFAAMTGRTFEEIRDSD